jgi:hypothetical protein
MNVSISSDSGIVTSGVITLPMNIAEVSISGQVTSVDGLTASGSINSNSVSFKGVELPIINTTVTIDDGIFLSGAFTLPGGLKTANMQGSITSAEMKLVGELGTNVTLSGHTFQISNPSITASTVTGVDLSFNIDLYQFTSDVGGPINPNQTFELVGSRGFSRGINFAGQSATLAGTIVVHVTHTGINLTGSGRVTYTGLLGNTHELYSGPLSINPNWSAHTIEVCASGHCINI